MPRIFDNVEQLLLPALREALDISYRADFCVGYFNLRGWRQIDSSIGRWAGGQDQCCRLLVGMYRPPAEELERLFRATEAQPQTGISNREALRLKKNIVEDFRRQLTIGVPTDADEAGLRRLAAQIRAGQLVAKLFLQYPLHAKLYLAFRQDPITPIVGYLGSSNLTFAGLCQQGELNIDITDNDACKKLARWFEDRWNDRKCIDISGTLVGIIEESWAREKLIPPYHIYVKMAYHLSQEARAGLAEYSIPSELDRKLFDFQKAAVKIAAKKVDRRGGVLIGDVVGLGKTLVATALARVFENQGMDALIICPRNLVPMWVGYRERYGLRGTVLSLSRVMKELPTLRPYRLIIIDESHNLRNREGKRFGVIRDYIEQQDSRCILLTATPFNKACQDLSSQLRLFIPDDQDVGIRPERLIRSIGETEFSRKYQCPSRTLAAFDKSEDIDDWRELMRLFMVRRTRSFIEDNYAGVDPANGRKYLTFEDGTRSYFPVRQPKTVAFPIDDNDPSDQYARLYATPVVDVINALLLPRYGLGNYLVAAPPEPPTKEEESVIAGLSRAGKRLIGYSRTNLFKRLESCGHAFIQSIERHILRNYVFLHAIGHGEPLPLGTQDADMLDSRLYDGDAESIEATLDFFDGDEDERDESTDPGADADLRTEESFRARASTVYGAYRACCESRFTWIRPALFRNELAEHLRRDALALLGILRTCGRWDPSRDAKLAKLLDIVQRDHPDTKVLVFSQFADTVRYVALQLEAGGVGHVVGITGASYDPYAAACQFSPVSNDMTGRVRPENEIRVLIATDVLSEGQNLQDCSIVVNYDLPWAIIRLTQRVGRVDRIGQRAETIQCYSFLPATGVERIIRLRARVRERLRLNAEILGTDEVFFEGDASEEAIRDLYNERAGILDDERDTETDLTSRAYEIWKHAVEADPGLEKIVTEMPDVVLATKTGAEGGKVPDSGVLVYQRTALGNDVLLHVAPDGSVVTESQHAILQAAACEPDTPALPRRADHHTLVGMAVEYAGKMDVSLSGHLRGVRRRVYDRLKAHAMRTRGTVSESRELELAVEDIYRFPLHQHAISRIGERLKNGATDEDLARLVVALRADDRLCVKHEDGEDGAPQIICSMGLIPPGGRT